jgi:hypothetical protein
MWTAAHRVKVQDMDHAPEAAMGFHTSYAFSAPADAVFDTLTQLSLINEWLPDGVSLAPNHDGTVDARRQGKSSIRLRLKVFARQNRLMWTPADGSEGWAGSAVISDLPICGSVIQVRLTLPDSQPRSLSRADLAIADLLRRADAATPAQARRAA